MLSKNISGRAFELSRVYAISFVQAQFRYISARVVVLDALAGEGSSDEPFLAPCCVWVPSVCLGTSCHLPILRGYCSVIGKKIEFSFCQ